MGFLQLSRVHSGYSGFAHHRLTPGRRPLTSSRLPRIANKELVVLALGDGGRLTVFERVIGAIDPWPCSGGNRRNDCVGPLRGAAA
jgi:hypothetical protein